MESKGVVEKKTDAKPVSFLSLFRYSTTADRWIILVGLTAAAALGIAFPLITIFCGELLSAFADYNNQRRYIMPAVKDDLKNENLTSVLTNVTEHQYEEQFFQRINLYTFSLLLVGLYVMILDYVTVVTFSLTARNQAHAIRLKFFRAALRLDIAWFDTEKSKDFASKLTTDLTKIQDAIGEKVGLCVYCTSVTLSSLISAFVYGWELALVALATTPMIVVSNGIISWIQGRVSAEEGEAYSKAGTVAEEVISSIRTVFAFGGEEKELERYSKNLRHVKQSSIKRGIYTAAGWGIMWFFTYSSYGITFWYAIRLVLREEYDVGRVVIVFFNVLVGALYIGQTSPYIEAINIGRGAASKIFQIIENKPAIDRFSSGGQRLQNFGGEITLKGVSFSYPSRSDVTILRDLTLHIPSGSTIALVGPSGCGKSTVIQLVQRFYDPAFGVVAVDGMDLKDVNVGWLRDQIGVVGQEPVLFGMSIGENIKLGNPFATEEQIMQAAKDANVHDFISKLPNGYETVISEGGGQLSGGQKQRIAIARALVKQPKILLLDEATSALDFESESLVQAALDRARKGRTTIIVAHRLSTIQNADTIFVLDGGSVKESGNHSDLMTKQGLYYQLVKNQEQTEVDEVIETKEITNGDLKMVESVYSKEKDSVTLEVIVDSESEEKSALARIASMMFKYKFLLSIASLSAIVMGLSFPFYGIVFGEIVGAIGDSRINELSKNIHLLAGMFVLLGTVAGTASFLQTFLFSLIGERITMRLRRMCFQALLRQDVSFYDKPENSTGTLCAKLSSDTADVQGAAGTKISILCQAVACISALAFMVFAYNWKIGTLAFAFLPLILTAGYYESLIFTADLSGEEKSKQDASKVAIEALSNIRTVVSLRREDTFYNLYLDHLEVAFKKSKLKCHVRAMVLGVSQSLMSFTYSACLWYGARLFHDGQVEYKELFKVVEAILYGAFFLGQALSFSVDYQKGRRAAINIFKLVDLKPAIEVDSNSGNKLKSVDGTLTFEDVHFAYPSRKGVNVLQGASFNVDKNQTVALVGGSGCGKSTLFQLLERFYNCGKGYVLLDDVEITKINVPFLRSKIGFVQQEPTLFSYSIKDNIAYGDNAREVPMDEIVRSAEKANVHKFIKSLPMGYDTSVGDKGAQLSGGQKQRIAIARALVRNPAILLLDEATSALDSESEKVVQEALNEAMKGRTCLVIAHRLSTIQDADKIVVLKGGKVVEEGTHNGLIGRKGAYFDLYNAQK